MPCPQAPDHTAYYVYAPDGGPLEMYCDACRRFWALCGSLYLDTRCGLEKLHDGPHTSMCGRYGWTDPAPVTPEEKD